MLVGERGVGGLSCGSTSWEAIDQHFQLIFAPISRQRIDVQGGDAMRLSCRVNARHAPHPYCWLHKHLQRQVIAILPATATTPLFPLSNFQLASTHSWVIWRAAVGQSHNSPAALRLSLAPPNFPSSSCSTKYCSIISYAYLYVCACVCVCVRGLITFFHSASFLVYTNIYLLIEAVAGQIVNLKAGTHSVEWEWDSGVTILCHTVYEVEL